MYTCAHFGGISFVVVSFITLVFADSQSLLPLAVILSAFYFPGNFQYATPSSKEICFYANARHVFHLLLKVL